MLGILARLFIAFIFVGVFASAYFAEAFDLQDRFEHFQQELNKKKEQTKSRHFNIFNASDKKENTRNLEESSDEKPDENPHNSGIGNIFNVTPSTIQDIKTIDNSHNENRDTKNIPAVNRDFLEAGERIITTKIQDATNNLRKPNKDLFEETAKSFRFTRIKAEKLKREAHQSVLEGVNDIVKKIDSDIVTKIEKAPSVIKTQIDVRKDRGADVSKYKSNRNIKERFEVIKNRLEHKTKQTEKYINTVVESTVKGETSPEAVNVVVLSSLNDVKKIVKEQTGIEVNIDETSRKVVSKIEKQTKEFKEQLKSFSQRDGLDLYRDSDGDGVSDYDEKNIYFTDPNNAHTAGAPLTDGELILLGLDVHSQKLEPVPVESPISASTVSKDIYEVNKIEPKKEGIVFEGKALPNSFVTLFIYSTPIVVTVKTDTSGKWSYTLKKELPDGNHTLYTASVDNSGKILARSPKVPFVKTAEAVDFTPLVPRATPKSKISVFKENALITSVLLFGFFILLVISVLGFWKIKTVGDEQNN